MVCHANMPLFNMMRTAIKCTNIYLSGGIHMQEVTGYYDATMHLG